MVVRVLFCSAVVCRTVLPLVYFQIQHILYELELINAECQLILLTLQQLSSLLENSEEEEVATNTKKNNINNATKLTEHIFCGLNWKSSSTYQQEVSRDMGLFPNYILALVLRPISSR